MGGLNRTTENDLGHFKSYLNEKITAPANTDTQTRNYVDAARDTLVQSVNDYPLTTLFGSTLLVLSLFPVLSFVGFCIFTGSIIIAASLAFCLFWLTLVIGSAVFVLLTVLSFALGAAVLITGTAAVALLATRLVINIRDSSSVRQGITNFVTEVRQYVGQGKVQAASPGLSLDSSEEELVPGMKDEVKLESYDL